MLEALILSLILASGGPDESPHEDSSSQAYPQSTRTIRVHALTSIVNPLHPERVSVRADLEISAKANAGVKTDAKTRVILNINESYYGLFFEAIDLEKGMALFRTSEGKQLSLDAGSSASGKLFDSFRPLATEYVKAIDAGDEALLMADWEQWMATGESTLGRTGHADFADFRQQLQFITSSQKNNFLNFFTLKTFILDMKAAKDPVTPVQPDFMSDAMNRKILAQRRYAYLEPISQRLYFSKDYVNCAEPMQRKVAPWMKLTHYGLPAEVEESIDSMEPVTVDNLAYFFRRCQTSDHKEGVCCEKELGDASSSYCVERKDEPLPDILESCEVRSIDECGRRNQNTQGMIEGKACELGDSVGRCFHRQCIAADDFQDQYPCRVAVAIDAANVSSPASGPSRSAADLYSPERFAKKADGTPCGSNHVCRDGECREYRAADWKDEFDHWNRMASDIKVELVQTLAEAMALKGDGARPLVYPSCMVTSGEGLKGALANGTSCLLEQASWKKDVRRGNCWEGQCLPCHSQSKTKLLGLPPCPPIVIDEMSGETIKGQRLTCKEPEYCSYAR